MESSLMSEAAKDARIVSILVSSGYLESSTSAAIWWVRNIIAKYDY